MKILFVGMGSIGKRHLKNLTDILNKENVSFSVDALRSSLSPLEEDISSLITNQILKVEDDKVYDLAFITNPTTLHHEAIKNLKDKVKFFFIEKPIFEDSKYDLGELNLNEKNAYIACPMRYCKAYTTLKEVLQNEKVYTARIICSSYLPSWRPTIDYRKNYSAIKALGGGVTIDLIHELDYMVDLFGFPNESYNIRGKYSHLEIDSDDLSVYLAKYDDKITQVHLDYFGKKHQRTCEVFTENGNILAEFNQGSLTLANGEVIDCNEEVNARFIKELEYVLKIMHGGAKNTNPPQHALDVLALTLYGSAK